MSEDDDSLYSQYGRALTEANQSAAALQQQALANMKSGSPGRMLLGAGQDILAPVAGVMSPVSAALDLAKQGIEYRFGEPAGNAFEVASNVVGGPEDAIMAAKMAARSVPKIADVATAAAPLAAAMIPAKAAQATTDAAAEATALARKLNDVGLYSHAGEMASTLQPRGDATQMISALKNMPGVKPEELQNAGLIDAQGNVHPEWAGRGKITREDLAGHLQSSMPEVQETVLKSGNPYPYRGSDEWTTAIQRAERAGNFNEAERLNAAWEAQEGYGSAGNAKYGKYTLPGGENYREVVLHLQKQKNNRDKYNDYVKSLYEKYGHTGFRGIGGLPLTPEEGIEYDRLLNSSNNEKIDDTPPFQSSHFPQPDILAHLRMADRTGPNGEKILHVEEIQSDWGQKGRDEGFDTPEMRSKLLKELPEGYVVKPSDYQRTGGITRYSVFDPNGVEVGIGNGRENAINSTLNDLNTQIRKTSASLVPTAPYVTNTGSWTDLALKRALKEAAEGGYDKLVWTPGAEQAGRYDLSKSISNVEYNPNSKTLQAIDHNKNVVLFERNVEPNKLPDFLGKEVAEKLMNEKNIVPFSDGTGIIAHELSGQDLSIGGEGMKEYYDKIVPNQLKKIAKHYDPNAKVGYTDVMLPPSGKTRTNNPPMAAPGLDITPQMREAIMRGQKAFKRGGRTLGNNAIDNAMRMALGGDAEIEMPHSLKELQDWKKTHPTPVSHSSMDNIFTNRVSGFEGAPPMAMPANLDELLAYLRRHHAYGGRAHFEDGGDSGGGDSSSSGGDSSSSGSDSSSSDSSGNDNVRADSLSQNEQRSADTQAAIDKAISEAKSQQGTDVRTGDTPGGLIGDTGGSSGIVSAAQGKIDAATAAAVDRAQQARELENSGTPDANVGGGSGDYMGNVKYTVADINNIAKQVGGIYGVDPTLIQAMIKNESQYNLNAIGSAGEVGLMQIKPSTYMNPGYGVTPGTDVSNLANPYNNIDFATRYLLARAGGADLSTPEGQAKALAAYNSSSTQDARDAYVKATQNAMGQTVSPEKMLGDVTINPANSGVYAALAKGVAQADATKTGAAEAGGAGPEARNLFTNRTTDATDTSSAIDQAKAAAVQPSILDRLNNDQISKLEDANKYVAGDRNTVAENLGVDPNDLKARIVMRDGEQKVEYYTKDLGQAIIGDAFNNIGTGISNILQGKPGNAEPSTTDLSYLPINPSNPGLGNSSSETGGVSNYTGKTSTSVNDLIKNSDTGANAGLAVDKKSTTPDQNALTTAATSTLTPSSASNAPYLSELSKYSLMLPSVTGQTAQQWADDNTGGDLSKVHASIQYVNGAPRLNYYSQNDAGYLKKYGDVITQDYQKLFKRAPDVPGEQYWANRVGTGQVSIDDLLRIMASGAATGSDDAINAAKYLALLQNNSGSPP